MGRMEGGAAEHITLTIEGDRREEEATEKEEREAKDTSGPPDTLTGRDNGPERAGRKERTGRRENGPERNGRDG